MSPRERSLHRLRCSLYQAQTRHAALRTAQVFLPANALAICEMKTKQARDRPAKMARVITCKTMEMFRASAEPLAKVALQGT